MRNPLAGTGLRRYTRSRLIHDRDAARAEVLRLEGVIRGLDATAIEQGERIVQLAADAVDVSVERQLRAAAEEKAGALEGQLLALRSQRDNEYAVTVPPMHRDIDDDEASTHPHGFDVRTLREALDPRAA
ncbi:hypothetical protein ACFYPC_09005 [Streptomyces sp. NPDC005808]|uniref:hypothetical protein n=1 Tax=Streptomyces sp. NPDC005808 TaxID=3364734 RepID=UPI003683B28C